MALSNRAYAKHRGITEHAVRRALAEGRISKTAEGKIDPIVADAQWDANSDPAQVKKVTATGTSPTYQQSRTVRETYNARLAKLQYEKETGKLLSAETVKRDVANAGRIICDRLLHIPDKIIPQLVGKTDIHAMKALLKDELISALDELYTLYGSRQ